MFGSGVSSGGAGGGSSVVVSVKDFGAVGDGFTNDGPAFVAALASLKATNLTPEGGFFSASPRLFVPAGTYYMGTTTIDITHTVIIEGEGVGPGGAKGSLLYWDAGVNGIRVQSYNTAGNTGDAPAGISGSGSIIRGLGLFGGYDPYSQNEGDYHGIVLRARAVIENCHIEYFQGNGIHSVAVAGGTPNGNANCSIINHVGLTSNRHGLFIDGADTNAWVVTGVDTSGNRQWGIFDSSFLGNTYIGCHAAANGWDGAIQGVPTACVYNGNRYYVKTGQAAGASTNPPTGTTADNTWWGYMGAGGTYTGIVNWANGTIFNEGGAYHSDNPNASNVFVGCYSEGDQNPSQLRSPTLVLGGLHGAKIVGDYGHLTAKFGGIDSHRYKSFDPNTGNSIDLSYANGLQFNHVTHGAFSLEWMGNDLAWTIYNSGIPSNWAFRLTGDNTTSSVGSRKMDFLNGFGLGGKKVLSGNAPPVAGNYVRGDMMWNATPTAGGPMGWMCVADGTPGTWKAMTNLEP